MGIFMHAMCIHTLRHTQIHITNRIITLQNDTTAAKPAKPFKFNNLCSVPRIHIQKPDGMAFVGKTSTPAARPEDKQDTYLEACMQCGGLNESRFLEV